MQWRVSFAQVVEQATQRKASQHLGIVFTHGFGHGYCQNPHAARMKVRIHVMINKMLDMVDSAWIILEAGHYVVYNVLHLVEDKVVHACVKTNLHKMRTNVLGLRDSKLRSVAPLHFGI